MSEHGQQQPAPRRGKVLEVLARAERKVFTRPAPKSVKSQVKVLLTRAKGSTKSLAERLGVSRRTVERYRAGAMFIHADGLIDCWGLVTLEEFQEKLRSGWVATSLPDGAEASEHDLAGWSSVSHAPGSPLTYWSPKYRTPSTS
ncbi:hypothetical protein OG936_00440 [Streptomyces sp. NBC_00846]|uniref:DUF7638 domain-containing protein n=1 Tax=Streptomyces sp. NBC_00846 TaxID=2975849 RepID=UPI0038662319|nr:hypothetical protein OG936_00440 [Streptomyces sp. NBC_00846]